MLFALSAQAINKAFVKGVNGYKMKNFKLFVVTGILMFILPVISVSAASTMYIDKKQCYAVKNDNSLWTWEYGNSDKCEKILDDVESVCGNYAIKTDGSLWTWGESLFGEFETPTAVMEDVRDIDISRFFAFIVKNDNSLWFVGSNYDCYMGLADPFITTSKPIKVMNNVKKAVVGINHGVILKTDGSIITTGLNMEGQLGIGKSDFSTCRAIVDLPPAYDICCGQESTYAKCSNMLWMWGTAYEFGDIQDEPKEYSKNIKQLVSREGYDIILKDDGSVWFSSADQMREKGFATVSDGVVYFQFPYHVMDNVCFMSEASTERIGTTSPHEILLLADYGVLYECNLESESPFVGRVKIKASNIKDIKQPQIITEQKMNEYTDIKDSDFKNEITSLAKAGIVKGVTDDKFMPDNTISRAESAALLLRMTGKENETAASYSDFSDVPQDSWYYNTAGLSQNYGIIQGYDDNTFRGEETVSDLQLAVLAARTIKNEGTAIAVYKDKQIDVPDNIPLWAADDIACALKYGIITKAEASNLSDEHDMTRGEAAVMLYRLYNAI